MSELLIPPKENGLEDRTSFKHNQEYYYDNVKSGLEAWFYLQVLDYLSGETPKELLREDYIANKEKLYNLYVQRCKDMECKPTSLDEMERELNDILEVWSNVFPY